jgi:hypothetical protein
MLKAHVNNETWLVQQPHHAQVSGFLAAHWGSANGFARPGHYPGATHPERWRDEVVLGIAEHDNGWWETEAMPLISDKDGLPVGVGEAAPPTDENEFTPWITGGFDRWRTGIGRLAETHPYAALLTSLHAYWLYAVVFDDLTPKDVDHRRHFVFGAPEVAEGLVNDQVTTRSFLTEQADLQKELKSRLAKTPELAGLVRKEHLEPHVRLLQLLDSMSLMLALNDTRRHSLPHVPRASWDDRVELTWTRVGTRTIEIDPYPFDANGLVVAMPVRVIPDAKSSALRSPISRLHGSSVRSIEFEFIRRKR